MKLSERFTIIRELGTGATGRVLLAMDQQLGREVALKFMRRSEGGKAEENFLRRIMEKEATFLAKFEHPNVLPIYDYFDSSEGPVLVLRRVHGTLNHYAKGIASDEGMVHRLLRQVAEAVDFCADSGFAHRDIKPSNVLVDQSGHAYLGDFGFAARFDDSVRWEGIVGTPPFIAPELVHRNRGSHGEGIRSRCDVFSYGVTTYCLLTGDIPFPGSHGPQESTALRLIRGERPEPVHQRNPNLPGPINEVVDRLLHIDPSSRYPSATAAWKEIDEVLNGRAKSKCPLFISYSHRDEAEVTAIIHALTREGYPVWWDKQLLTSKPWAKEIQTGMKESQFMLFMASQASVESDEAYHEWHYFRSKLKKPVIPVLLDDADLPFHLDSLQRIDVRNKPTAEAARIISREIVRLNEARTATAGPTPATPVQEEQTCIPGLTMSHEGFGITHSSAPPVDSREMSLISASSMRAVDAGSLDEDATMLGGRPLEQQFSPVLQLEEPRDMGELSVLPARPDYFELKEGKTMIVRNGSGSAQDGFVTSTETVLAWDYPEELTWIGHVQEN